MKLKVFLEKCLKTFKHLITIKFTHNPVQIEAKSMLKKIFMKVKALSEKGLKTFKNENLHIIPYKLKQNQCSEEYL